MVGFVFPGLAVSQEAALTHMDVDTLHTSIPEPSEGAGLTDVTANVVLDALTG